MKNFRYFIFYFILSTILTWWFVIRCPLYISTNQMLLSSAIAGGKWLIQIIAGLIILRENASIFLRKIGFVCFVGSCILIPYILSAYFGINDSPEFFFSSLVVSVLVMIVLYYNSVKQVKLSINWWIGWLICLAIAISLQLTVVFGFISF